LGQAPENMRRKPVSDTEQVDQAVEQADSLGELPDGFTVQPDGGSWQPSSSGPRQDRLTKNAQLSNWTVLAMIVLCFVLIVRFRPFAARDGAEGKTLAQVRLQPLVTQGQPVGLEDLTGRVVLLVFWEPDAALSRDAFSQVAALERQFRGRPTLRFLPVSCSRSAREDVRRLRGRTREVLRAERLEVPTYSDPGGVTRSAVDEAVGLSGYPTTLILDRQGRIRKAWTGFEPGIEAEMRQLLTKLLDEG
jgi:hypothetical protein